MGRVQQFCGLTLATIFMVLISGCALFNGSGPGDGGNGGGKGGGSGDITAVNHIIFMAQENRSFDTYFGKLNDYRASQGLPQEVDGMPADASNPADDGSMIHAFHFNTTCIENTSAAWATSHINFHRKPSGGGQICTSFHHDYEVGGTGDREPEPVCPESKAGTAGLRLRPLKPNLIACIWLLQPPWGTLMHPRLQ